MRRLAPFFLLCACVGDNAPRVLSSTVLLDTPDTFGPYHVLAVVDDDRRVDRVWVQLRTQDVADATEVALQRSDEGWRATLPPYPFGTEVHYLVFAQAGDRVGVFPIDGVELRFVVGNVPSQPELLALWPNEGPASGGTEVLLVGRDFRAPNIDNQLVLPRIRFGANDVSAFERPSPTQARALTPMGEPGLVDVTLINADGGETTLPQAFRFLPTPEIEAVIPNQGPVAGGTQVRIVGRRFDQEVRFYFDGAPATGVLVVSPFDAFAFTPPHPAGKVDVRVEHPRFGFSTRPQAYEYIPPPEILSIVPDRGPDTGETRVVVTGRFFTAGAQLLFDDRPAIFVSVNSPTEIIAATPAHPEGLADVRVINPDLQEAVLADGFLFIGPPILERIEPPFSAVEGGAEVQVFGRNFWPDSRLSIDGSPTNCTYLSTTQLRCTTPQGVPGPSSVTLDNPDGRSVTARNLLTYFSLNLVVPGRGLASGGTEVLVQGEFLPDVEMDISFGANLAACLREGPNLRCITPPGPPNQFVDVSALPQVPGQVPTVLADGYFYVPPPDIQNVTPNQVPTVGGVRIQIQGLFFQPGATVLIGGVPCQDVVVLSDRLIECTVPPRVAGRAAIVVTNPDGQSDTYNNFEYVPITVTPDWGLVDGQTNLVIRGANFQPGLVLTLGSQTIGNYQRISDRELRLVTPPVLQPGPVTVTIRNPGQMPESAPRPFSYRVYRERSVPSMGGTGDTVEVMMADLDGDGDNDFVYVAGSPGLAGAAEITENRNGSFFTRTLGNAQVGGEGNICDLDGDGLPELTWGVSGGASPIWRNNGGLNFSFSGLTGVADAFETSFHDMDRDGDCDLVNAGISGPDTIWRNNGQGVLTALPTPFVHEPGFIHDHKFDTGDLDGDGDIDLVMVVDDVNFGTPPIQRHRVYLNQGNLTFVEDLRNRPLMESLNGDVYDVRLGDIDLDGDLDLVAPNFGREPIVLLNDGTGRFTRDRTLLNTGPRGDSALVLQDLEGDGDLDLYLLDFTGASSGLFLNNGQGRFFPATQGQPQGNTSAFRAAWGDINGDGKTDILLGALFGANQMYFAEE